MNGYDVLEFFVIWCCYIAVSVVRWGGDAVNPIVLVPSISTLWSGEKIVLFSGSTRVGNATLVVANVLTCNKHSQKECR
jgi:hypothetical protein